MATVTARADPPAIFASRPDRGLELGTAERALGRAIVGRQRDAWDDRLVHVEGEGELLVGRVSARERGRQVSEGGREGVVRGGDGVGGGLGICDVVVGGDDPEEGGVGAVLVGVAAPCG
jgi:hypothetical protein